MSSFWKTKQFQQYGSQLDQLKAALDEKHPELVNRKCIIFHQDNARPHISLMTRRKLLQLGWEVLIHPKRPELVNRKRIIFHQDNARPHISLMTRQKLLQLSWEVLIHLPYSADIAPADFHLFRSLQNSLNGKNFDSLEDCNSSGTWNSSLLKKINKFWEDGIMKLPEKWQKVVEQNSEVNTLFNKVLGENEKCVYYFYLKTKGTFWPTQYLYCFLYLYVL